MFSIHGGSDFQRSISGKSMNHLVVHFVYFVVGGKAISVTLKC